MVGDLLFGAGIERPWFTPGVLELVSGGTVVLEEVCHLPEPAKALLLKALDRPPLLRQRGRRDRTWLITTCNIDMDAAMEHGYFARNLFRRLAEVRIRMPPLPERGNDVLMLANWLLPRICEQEHRSLMTLAPEVGPELLRYKWPGNVRELTHRLTRAVLLTTGSVIAVKDLELPPISAPPDVESLRRAMGIIE